jgi:pimeloyl-ACP methyl ester carboxylesterase
VSVRDHHIQIDGGRVFAREWQPDRPGTAPPIILLHDSLGCITLWRDFPADLSARTGRRVVAYDRLGFGQSDAFPGRLPLDFIYTEGRASLPPLLAALNIEEFVLFGHSVGGGMSVAGAADFGARCKGLISESAQIVREERTFEGIRAAQPNVAPGSAQHERLKKYHGEKTDWVLSSWIDNWLDPAFALDLTGHMKEIRCPVLALHGDLDEFGSLEQAKYLCDHVAGAAKLHLMKSCGHVPHRDRPAEILDTVANFLS